MSRTSKASGFSLIELLVAMLVLAVIGLVTAGIISATDRGTSLSNRAIDAGAQARLAFDRIGIDLRGLVKRNDVNFDAQNVPVGTADDMVRFVSSVSSAGVTAADNRNFSFVAYRVDAHSDNAGRLCLVRGAKAIKWGDAGFFGLQTNGLPLASFPAASLPAYPADYDVLAPGVIRMVVGFQLYPDNLPVTLADSTSLAAARGQVVYSPPVRSLTPIGGGSPVNYVDLSRISAVIVGLVVLDLKTLNLANASQINTLVATFPVPANGQLPVQAWFVTANNVSATGASVPLPVRKALRVFERCYPLTPFGTKGTG
jgi:prepilin-type N-terminal cleavage/methylation domain-containing protein